MKRIQKIAAVVLTMLISTISFGQGWTADKAHSKVGFEVVHLMVTNVEGWFKNVDITINSSKDDFTDAVVEVTADVNSINTENERRDNDLRSDHFFDVAKYPTLNFKSTSFEKTGDKTYKLSGNLTMHGVTKAVVLDVTLNGIGTHPMTKKPVAGFKIKGTIKRSDFGIGANTPTAIVSDEVDIIANVEIDKS